LEENKIANDIVNAGLACIRDLKSDIKELINPYFDEKGKNIDQINKNFMLNVR